MSFLDAPQQRAALLILVLGAGIALALSPFAVGLLGALVLYVICKPMFRRMRRIIKSDLAAALTLVVVIVLIVIPAMGALALVIGEAPTAFESARNSDIFNRLNTLRIGRINVGAELAKASGTILQFLSAQALNIVGSLAHATLNLVISFFGLYYLLVAGPRSWRASRGFIPFSPETADKLRDRFFSVTHATLLGTLLTSLAQGTLIGVSFLLLGLPSPIFWGVATGFAAILPVLGSGLVWFPAMIVLAAQGRYGAAVVMLVIGGVVASNVDNVIRPMVYKRVSDIHPMITLIGAFAGVKYFGLLGVLLGPLAIAYFFELIQMYREEYGVPDADDDAIAEANVPRVIVASR